MVRKNTVGKKTSSGKTPQNTLSPEQLNEEIRKVARQIYEKRGCMPGKEMDDWLEAERQVRARITK